MSGYINKLYFEIWATESLNNLPDAQVFCSCCLLLNSFSRHGEHLEHRREQLLQDSFICQVQSVPYRKSKTIKIKIKIHLKITYPVLGCRSPTVRYFSCRLSTVEALKIVEVFNHQPVQYCDKIIDMLLQIKTAWIPTSPNNLTILKTFIFFYF